ncbi:MAG: cation diffusion facilitator family transporter [Rhodospirillales bacterium]
MTENLGSGRAATPPLPGKDAARLMRLATYGAVSVAAILIVAKFGAWLATESVSLLSTLIDSLLDVGASLVNLFAVRRALQPADIDHRFGHGKAEPLAGLAQSAFICGSALFLVIESADRFIHPRTVVNTDTGYLVMVFSIVLTVSLVAFQRHVVKKTGSLAISADSLHYQTDVMINLSVVVSLWLAGDKGIYFADPLFAIVIAAYLVWGALKIGGQSLNLLMDRELPIEDRRRIREIALAHWKVLDMHDMRTRSSGTKMFIQLHLEMDGDMTLNESHEVTEDVMHEIERAFPNADIIIHEDPLGVDEKRDGLD